MRVKNGESVIVIATALIHLQYGIGCLFIACLLLSPPPPTGAKARIEIQMLLALEVMPSRPCTLIIHLLDMKIIFFVHQVKIGLCNV